MNQKIIIALLILSATAAEAQTKLLIGTRNGVKDTVALNALSRIRPLRPAHPLVEPVRELDFEREEPWAVAADTNGNLYVSLSTMPGTSLGVVKIAHDGTRSTYALKGAEPYYSSLKVGPGDTLFAARRVAALFYFDPGTVSSPKVYVSKTTSPMMNIADFDYDVQKNIWGGGQSSDRIYRIDRNKKIREFPFSGVVHAVRCFRNALYVAGRMQDSLLSWHEAVYRVPINAADTSLGTPTVYFDLSAQSGYQLNTITAITLDAEGRLYVGTDGQAGIFVVPEANAAPTVLYNGLIGSNVVAFQWGPGSIMYVIRKQEAGSRTPQVLLKVDMRTQSAPYYGRE